ncbi:MAG TPA: YihY/virulence factor BrkB family protein [Mycobacteriales bacterium]|nr:YihY/virulence factor BrkB family protein [Mycobacteriales bacterium]
MVGKPDISRLRARADAYQQQRPWLAFPLAVLVKFGEDSSGNLAVVITYYAFFSIFPLLLALASISGFVLAGHPSWQMRVENSAVSTLPLIKHSPLPHHGSVIAVVLGTVLALYSGLGVAKAGETAWNAVYCVKRDERPNWLQTNLRALRTVLVGGLGLVVTTAIAGTVTSGHALGIPVGWGLTVVGVVLTAALNTAVFVVVFRWLTVRRLSVGDVLPGAAFAAMVLAVLQALSAAFISHKLRHASSTYGSFGTVIVLLSWIYLQAQVVLLAVQVNVVKQDRLWPRSIGGETATR